MRRCWLLILVLSIAIPTHATVAPVTVKLPMPSGWAGQRIPLIVELRASGSFAGTATFELPQLDGTLVMKIGTPVVGSEDIDGESWMVQSHEFALFSQRSGMMEIPPFPVHFSHHQGFTGPVSEVQAQVPGAKVEVKQPPGIAPSTFFLTTESLTVRETWEPKPGPVQVGAMFKRTIVQQATNISGMALVPGPTVAPDGLRLYPGNVETNDTTDRGDLVGERRETLTYLVTKPGTYTLPALTYSWWNPETEQVQTTTLDAITIKAAPNPSAASDTSAGETYSSIVWLGVAVFLCIAAILQRRQLSNWLRSVQLLIFPHEKKMRRRLLAACDQNSTQEAESAWFAWLQCREADFTPDSLLQSAVQDLYRHIYGTDTADTWQGKQLRQALARQLRSGHGRPTPQHRSALPALNPLDHFAYSNKETTP